MTLCCMFPAAQTHEFEVTVLQLSERSHVIQDNLELRLTSLGISSVILEQELCSFVSL